MKHLSKLFLDTLGMVSACPGISRSQYFTRQQLDDYERQKEQQRRLAQENRMKRVIVDLCKSKVKLVTDEYIKIVSVVNGLEVYKSTKTNPKRVWQDYILFLFGMNLEDLERHKEYILKIE